MNVVNTTPTARLTTTVLVLTLLSCLPALSGSLLKAQTGHLFIEPNMSFSYDSSSFSIVDRGSKTVYPTMTYQIVHAGESGYSEITLGALVSDRSRTQAERDSMVALAIIEANKFDNGIVKLHKPAIAVHYKDFTGVATILRAKQEAMYSTSIMCAALFPGGACNIIYGRQSTRAIESYEADLAVLRSVIDGLRFHTKEELVALDNAVRSSVSVKVVPVERPADIPRFVTATYFGTVTVTGPAKYTILQAWIPTDRSLENATIYEPNAAGELIIQCKDERKGTIEKDCELVVLDELGRQVRLPFTVSYVNH